MGDGVWEREGNPEELLRLVRDTGGRRKLRLLACACARRMAPAAGAAPVLALAERIADGAPNVDADEWRTAHRQLHDLRRGSGGATRRVAGVLECTIGQEPYEDAYWAMHHLANEQADSTGRPDPALQAALIREVFGNPFRPIDFSAWRTGTVVSLARGAYESHDFSALPILADALQEAGCDNDEVLGHCRAAGHEHVRGCWVVDGALGKT